MERSVVKTMLAEVLLVMAGLMLATVGQWIVFEQTAPFFQAFETATKHEWVGRIVGSFVQAGIVGLYLTQGPATHWGVALFIGYILHDVTHMLIYDRDITSYLHHIVATTVAGLMTVTMTPDQAKSIALAAAVLESTGPFLHSTWLLKEAGYSSHPAFKYIAATAAGVFGVMRCGVFPWVMATQMDTVTALVVSPFLALNLYWFWKILNMMKKVVDKAA